MTGLAVVAQFRMVVPCPISPRRATGQTRVTKLELKLKQPVGFCSKDEHLETVRTIFEKKAVEVLVTR